MTCKNRRFVFKVLTGELSPSKSTEMLEHFRVCGECREGFEFGAKTITRTTGGPSAAEPELSSAPTPEPRPFLGSWPNPVRRNRRNLIVFGVAVLALVLSGVGGRRPDKDAEPPAEVFVRRALAEGSPVVQSPAGTHDGRPRVITALLPVGSSQIRVAVVDDSGKVVFEREAKPGILGCFSEESSIEAPGGAFRAASLLFPFPEEGALALAPGRAYGVVVSVAGGHASSSSVFQIRPAEGVLQGQQKEER